MSQIKEPHPTLLIGLGGTGQWVVCHVLKELMELYGLQKPSKLSPRVQILAIDTDDENLAKVGLSSATESVAQVGQVRLPKSMRVSLGENVYEYGTDIHNGDHPDIDTWFDAAWFLGQQNASALFNLSDGAGAFRPLGRLAVPYNLTQARVPTLRRALEGAIRDIKTAMHGRLDALTVCLAGSLCGGTGAGLFVDVAYLARKLAAPTVVKTVGYLALPQAFDDTVPENEAIKRAIRRHSFAAMRELRRFARQLDYDVGYPMFYATKERAVDDEVLRGRLNKTLFDLLYYFDASLSRPRKLSSGREELQAVELQDGVAPLIAEAMLVWIDGETAVTVQSHGANLPRRANDFIAAGQLDPGAAVAGGVGAFSIQLPLFHIIEGWAHKLARDSLRAFLGVEPEKGEDATGKTATILMDNWAGGDESPSGASVARTRGKGSEIGGETIGGLVKDHLMTGDACLEGDESATDRQEDLNSRSLSEWERLMEPSGHWVDERERIRTEFLHPQEVAVERNFLGRATKKQAAIVKVSTGQGAKNPAKGARRVSDEVEAYLTKHLGQSLPGKQTRGGTETKVSGQYPKLLRDGAVAQVLQFQRVLRTWVADVLNGLPDDDRSPRETAERGEELRAGKLGHLLSLLRELVRMLLATTEMLEDLESVKLSDVVDARASQALIDSADEMKKKTRAQKRYLEEQQRVLEAERAYAAVRQARWAAEQMHDFAQRSLDAADAWRAQLAHVLYRAVWEGSDAVADNRAGLQDLGAIREALNVPVLENQKYTNYSMNSGGIGAILSSLRWEVQVGDVFDPERKRTHPALVIDLALEDDVFSLNPGDSNAEILLDRCRQPFAEAWRNETLLGWLDKLKKHPGLSPDELASRLANKGGPALRQAGGSQPYKVGYVRQAARGRVEKAYVEDLVSRVMEEADTEEAAESRAVESSDQYRLTFLSFDELIDVENLEAYREGRDGVDGAGGYIRLPARTGPGGGTSRQILHVFPAERNAAIYEERLGKLLPDKVVMLLEDLDQFQFFVLAWAYGTEGGNPGMLLHAHHIDRNAAKGANRWVWRMATGPFPEDIDPITRERLKEPKQWWLAEPTVTKPPLIRAAETFLINGSDKWQADDPQEIDYQRVLRQVGEMREKLAKSKEDAGVDSRMRKIVDSIVDDKRREEAHLRLAEYEHLQALNKKLRGELVPEASRLPRPLTKRGLANEQDDKAEDVAHNALEGIKEVSDRGLDVDLMEVMQLVIADELIQIEQQITS